MDPHPTPSATARPGLDALLLDANTFVSPPEVYLRISELMRSERASARDFADVVVQDPSLTARLLGMANSAYFGMRGRIDTITRAITVVGTQELHSLVLAVSAVSSFSRLDNHLVSVRTFWRHSVLTGLLARGIAQRGGVPHPDRLFVAGMLHDVGYLVLFNRIPQVMQDALTRAEGDEDRLHELERSTLGYAHPEVAARLFEAWGLPETVTTAVRQHHGPDMAGDDSVEARIVRLADALAASSEVGALFQQPGARTRGPELLASAAALGLDEERLDAVFAHALDAFTETISALTA